MLCLSHMKAIFQSFFLNKFLKTCCFVLKLSPQNADNRILHCFRALKFQNFLGQNAPGQTLPSPSRRGLAAPCCWNSQLLYSNLLATSIFIETPASGFPWASSPLAFYLDFLVFFFVHHHGKTINCTELSIHPYLQECVPLPLETYDIYIVINNL